VFKWKEKKNNNGIKWEITKEVQEKLNAKMKSKKKGLVYSQRLYIEKSEEAGQKSEEAG